MLIYFYLLRKRKFIYESEYSVSKKDKKFSISTSIFNNMLKYLVKTELSDFLPSSSTAGFCCLGDGFLNSPASGFQKMLAFLPCLSVNERKGGGRTGKKGGGTRNLYM